MGLREMWRNGVAKTNDAKSQPAQTQGNQSGSPSLFSSAATAALSAPSSTPLQEPNSKPEKPDEVSEFLTGENAEGEGNEDKNGIRFRSPYKDAMKNAKKAVEESWNEASSPANSWGGIDIKPDASTARAQERINTMKNIDPFSEGVWGAGNSALAQGAYAKGSKDPKKVEEGMKMNLGGEDYHLVQPEGYMPTEYAIDAAEFGDKVEGDYNVVRYVDEQGNVRNALVPKSPENDTPEAVRWKNDEVIVNPTEFERDAYNYMMNDQDFAKFMLDTYGIDDFGADMFALRSPDYRDAWMMFMQDMHDMNKGYYNDIYSDPAFLDEQGAFDPEKFWAWVDENAGILDYFRGSANALGGDWISSGGYASNRNLASGLANNWLSQYSPEGSIPQIRFGFDSSNMTDQEFAELQNGYNDSLGIFAPEDAKYYVAPEAENDWYMVMSDPEMASQYMLQSLIMESLVNSALDEQYGSYEPNANEMNQLAGAFDQSDLYWDYAGGDREPLIENPYEYFGGDPEYYRNLYNPSYSDIASYARGENRKFNLGSTGYGRNPNLRKFYVE